MPLVSIIIPSFQAGHYIGQALQSISSQTFTDYEVLIIDGCSTDNTAEVVAGFSHLPVIFKQEPDKGIYDAMNKGMRLSKGDFLYFMGCDDKLFSNNVLEKVFSTPNVLENHVVYGDVIFSDSGYRYDGEFTHFKLFEANISHQAIFYRKKIFEVLGVFDIRYKLYADWEFNMRWFNADWIRQKYIPIIIALYDVGGLSSSLNDEVFFAEKEDLRKKYFSKLVIYLASNVHRPLHYRIMKLLTFKRLAFIKKITKVY